ncbi:MAG: hypothetical protein HY831_00450 [Candidatus Aenigmarchaeota archaeon]|nr:hypothetical protein [Candidatus Aenigmarchaeota archaeon]
MSRSRKHKKPVDTRTDIQLKYEAIRTEIDGIIAGGSFSNLTENLKTYTNLIDNSRSVVQREHRVYLRQQVQRVLVYIKSEMENLTSNIETRYISNTDLWTSDYQRLTEHEALVNLSSSLNYGERKVNFDIILEGIKELYKILDEHKRPIESTASEILEQATAEQPIDKYSGVKNSLKTAAAFTLITGLLAVGSYFAGRQGANNIPIEKTNCPSTTITNGKNPDENSQRPIIEKPSKETVRELDKMLEKMRKYNREKDLDKKQRELEK